ncbi:replicative DNA helicase [Anatilimnocola aggregata]|uniref:Replicative DNA helicase n=1 Tax=Anatilimnocola aggregata TaxID=2528021 RepID=A0A517YFE2_9BACT|nr:replicative DNA helicase [Anatilimnocola aggregata]
MLASSNPAQWQWIVDRMMARLRPSLFFDLANRKLFCHLSELHKNSKIDPTLLVASLKTAGDYGEVGGSAFLSKISNAVPNVAHADHYVDILEEYHDLREAWQLTEQVRDCITAGQSSTDVWGKIEQQLERERTGGFGVGSIRSFADMKRKKGNQTLMPSVIDQIGRQGETMNIVSATKIGKTWFTHMLALCIAVGREWLGFPTHKGRVLILDNELHETTLVHRISQVADALEIREAEYINQIDVEAYRGRLVDIHKIAERINRIPPNTYKAIVFDSLYRFSPKGCDENSNSDTTEIYNVIDALAARMGCLAICVRHTSKGSQTAKDVVDVGAGAGAQSRTVDAHLVLRHHEEEGAVVLAAALRSWAPLEPMTLRWTFPIFVPATDLDPLALRPDRPRKLPKSKAEVGSPLEPGWTAQSFVAAFLKMDPQPRVSIIAAALEKGISERRSSALLSAAESAGLAFLWQGGDRRQKAFANRPQTTLGIVSESAE